MEAAHGFPFFRIEGAFDRESTRIIDEIQGGMFHETSLLQTRYRPGLP
jgi:hypothetical protein